MKTLISKPTILFICALLLCINYLYSQNDTIKTIPFIERFTEGSLEVNNWTKESDNWIIDIDSGKPTPCISFNSIPLIEGEYNYSLTSDWISASELELGRIAYLNFNYKSSADTISNTENMFIEIYDAGEWHLVGMIPQQTISWKEKQLKLSPYNTSDQFKIRFRVNGINSSSGEYWLLDNISIILSSNTCSDFYGEYYWDNDNFGVKLSWEDNYTHAGNPGISWYYSDEIASYLGVDDGINWTYAVKWDSLPDYDNYYLYKIRYAIGEADFDNLFLKIWNGDSLICTRLIDANFVENDWNTFYVYPTVQIDGSLPIYIGIEVIEQNPDSYPVGVGWGPVTDSYSNLIRMENDTAWSYLSDYGLDYNWTLWCFLDPDSLQPFYEYHIQAYNIYRKSGLDTNYQLIHLEEYNNITEYEFKDEYPGVDLQTPYWYKITQNYINIFKEPVDTIETLPIYIDNSDDDFVMVFVTGENENTDIQDNVSLYPNPGKNYLNIKSEFDIESISIYNMSGEMVFEKNNLKETNVKYDISTFKSGVYLINMKTAVRVISKKIVIQ